MDHMRDFEALATTGVDRGGHRSTSAPRSFWQSPSARAIAAVNRRHENKRLASMALTADDAKP